MSETTLNPQQKEAAKKLLEQEMYQGDAMAAFRLCSGYALGKDEHFEKNPEKAMYYLEYSADLGFPHALDLMASIYWGTSFQGIKKERDIEKVVKYLKRLVVADKLYDYTKVDEAERNEFYKLQWNAYAWLGRLYIEEDVLFAQDSYLGYAISLKLAEERGCTESMYALGRYYRDRGGNYYPSQTLMKKRDVWGMALYYYERAINNDNSKFANAAMSEYNHLAQYINERDGRSNETAIPYYQS